MLMASNETRDLLGAGDAFRAEPQDVGGFCWVSRVSARRNQRRLCRATERGGNGSKEMFSALLHSCLDPVPLEPWGSWLGFGDIGQIEGGAPRCRAPCPAPRER